MIPAHLIQQFRNIPVHGLCAPWKEMALSTVGREGLEGYSGVRGEATP